MPISTQIFPYEQATGELCTSIVKWELRQRPILNWLGEGRVTRHEGVVRNIQGDNPLDQGFSSLSGIVKIDLDIIRETDIPKYINEMRIMGREIAQKQSTSFFAGLNEMFDHSKPSASDEANTNSTDSGS